MPEGDEHYISVSFPPSTLTFQQQHKQIHLEPEGSCHPICLTMEVSLEAPPLAEGRVPWPEISA
jgi:hypothetical protein